MNAGGVKRRGVTSDELDSTRRKRIRTPLFLQYEEAECGAACLGSMLAHFGRWVAIDELRKACGISRDGSTVLDVAHAAEKYGMKVDAWRKGTDDLVSMRLPAILFWEFNHFLILEGVGSGKYYLNDPANGRRVVGEEIFDQAFTGIVIEMQPGPDFRRGGSKRGVWQKTWPWLRNVRSTLVFALLCGLLLAVTNLMSPILLTVFIDNVLMNTERYWGHYVAAATVLLAGIVYILTCLQQRNLQKLAVGLSIVHTDRMLTHLFRLPARFFAHRFVGDLTVRVQLVDKIAAVMSKQYVAVVIELLMSCLFLVLMIVYSLPLTMVVVALAVADAVSTRLITKRRNDENLSMRREQSLLAGVTASGLNNIEYMRAIAGENDFFGRWTGYQARELTARQKFAELGYITMSLPNLFSLLSAAAVFGLGSLLVDSGDMTIGSLMGFYMLTVSFLAPVGRLVQSIDAFQMLESELQSIEDITSADADPMFPIPSDTESAHISTLNGKLRLVGRLEMRNVTFGYNQNKDPLIKDFDLLLEPGQRVAVIGTTGSGKSTLLKLASGEYTPWSGEVLFDGMPVHDIPRQVFTDSVGIVDQHVFMYSGTIRENLTMWNPAAPNHQIVAAAHDAVIHQEIVKRPSGYDSGVAEDGSNFSHGQRQRLEIARALVSEPSVLLLDEATSSLDAVTEVDVDLALRRRGCSCLVVAHRLTTIRDSDQIVVLDHGEVVQRGTHDELLADRDGLYARLV